MNFTRVESSFFFVMLVENFLHKIKGHKDYKKVHFFVVKSYISLRASAVSLNAGVDGEKTARNHSSIEVLVEPSDPENLLRVPLLRFKQVLQTHACNT